ncbi:hypothetical protein DFH11DRAFT_1565113 [Phellopilus nigrolimitatus]|nr:hypothetical protein DFH11DRAFT_1565113 [Phellopilus nigrolimitatus]
MAVAFSRRASDIEHIYQQPYAAAAAAASPSAYEGFVPPALHTDLFPGAPVSMEMYNARGEFNLSDIYGGYLASLDSNEAGQPHPPPSMGLYPQSALLYSTYPPASSPATSPYCLPCAPLVSHSGMIAIVDYTPSEGEANIPITVNVELRSGQADEEDTFGHDMSLTSMKLRLVLGRTAVKTTVKRLPPMIRINGEEEPEQENLLRLRLYAFAPTHSESRFPEQFCVPMTIQAMDAETEVVESFTFGSFTYWTPSTIMPASTVDSYKFPDLAAPAESDEGQAYLPSTESEQVGLVRTTNAPADALNNGAEAHAAQLEWVVSDRRPHPNTLDKKWSANEVGVGRRLIRFQREQSGNKLLVTCEVIPQEAYNDDDIIVSCIYRQETRNCWFTSVDVIYLLERLVGNPFTVEEKNRIRRNLEGFKPTTVSKGKAGYESFFQRIMDFPAPKPRNIEKDVKVFPWSVLNKALDKIISKYSVVPHDVSESSTGTSPEDSLSPSSGEVIRSAKGSRSRSASSLRSPDGNTGLQRPLKTVSSQQSLQPLVGSPPVLHNERTPLISETELPGMPAEQLYTFSQPDLTFSDNWRRRDSVVSLETTSSATDGYYSDPIVRDVAYDPAPSALHAHAFSNPYASNVSLAALSLEGNGHGNVGGALGDETPVHQGAHALGMDLVNNHAYAHSRQSSLGSELMYPLSDSPRSGSHDALVSPYGQTALGEGSSNDFLYAQFSTGSHSPFEDVVEKSC